MTPLREVNNALLMRQLAPGEVNEDDPGAPKHVGGPGNFNELAQFALGFAEATEVNRHFLQLNFQYNGSSEVHAPRLLALRAAGEID